MEAAVMEAKDMSIAVWTILAMQLPIWTHAVHLDKISKAIR
jgi:hypothetical protein